MILQGMCHPVYGYPSSRTCMHLQPGEATCIVGSSNCKVTQAVATKTIFGTGICFHVFYEKSGIFSSLFFTG